MSEKRNRGNKQDKLSSLHDDLLVKTLTLTRSCKTAIICSSLSKRWKGLYKRLPCLYFDEVDLYDTEKREDDKRQIVDRYIPKILACHNQKIDTFSMETSYMCPRIFQGCLEYLVTYHKVENLSLKVVDGPDAVCLPRNLIVAHGPDAVCLPRNLIVAHGPDAVCLPLNLFGCQSLVTFKMDTLSLRNTPRDPLGFLNLRCCDLAVHMDDRVDVERLNCLILRCPLLQNLRLELTFTFEEEYPGPLVISLHRLTNLDFRVCFEAISDMPLKVHIDAPELLTMRFYSQDGPDYTVEAHVKAPKLMEFTTYAYALTGKGILSNVSSFKALKSIHLVEIYVHPVDFCMMFAALPMLEKLAFSNCCFKKDQRYFENEKGIMAGLTEVRFTSELDNFLDDFLDAEKEMFHILLQATPNLKRLHYVLKKRKLDRKNVYFAIFGGLLSPDDFLNIKQSCEQVELTIFRNHNLQECCNG